MFRRGWLGDISEDPRQVAVKEAWNDDMAPTIMRGDPVVVDLSKRMLQHGGIFLLNHDGAPAMRRVSYDASKKKVRIFGDNPACFPYDADPAALKVVGRVVWQGRRL